jgi:hypothetical protein
MSFSPSSQIRPQLFEIQRRNRRKHRPGVPLERRSYRHALGTFGWLPRCTHRSSPRPQTRCRQQHGHDGSQTWRASVLSPSLDPAMSTSDERDVQQHGQALTQAARRKGPGERAAAASATQCGPCWVPSQCGSGGTAAAARCSSAPASAVRCRSATPNINGVTPMPRLTHTHTAFATSTHNEAAASRGRTSRDDSGNSTCSIDSRKLRTHSAHGRLGSRASDRSCREARQQQ